jgi:hypothetical protein
MIMHRSGWQQEARSCRDASACHAEFTTQTSPLSLDDDALVSGLGRVGCVRPCGHGYKRSSSRRLRLAANGTGGAAADTAGGA